MKHFSDMLVTLLDEEKRCLLDGNYSTLEVLAKQKLKVSSKLAKAAQHFPQETIELIRKKSEQNEALLLSAQRGLQSAISHLTEAAEGSFQAYSKEGQRKPLSKTLKVQQKI